MEIIRRQSACPRRRLWLALACLAAALSGVQAAEGTRTASQPEPPAPPAFYPTPSSEFESRPLAFTAGPRRSERTGDAAPAAMPSIWPVLMLVVLLCALFGSGLYLVKKYLPGHRQLFSHPAMEVLGRTHLDPRRYVSLLRVGKRIVVVGVSPDEMRPLSEITDEEEITAIMEVARPKTEMGLSIFQRLFQRQVTRQEAEENRALATARAEEITDQVSALRERIRAIRENEDPQRHIDAVG